MRSERLVFAAREALFAVLPRAASGEVRFRYLVDKKDMHAPVPAFGPQDDRVEYVHIDGGMGFRSREERTSFLAGVAPSAWTATERLETGLHVHGEAKMTKATFDALIKSTQATLRRAGSGSVSVQSLWGFRNLRGKRG